MLFAQKFFPLFGSKRCNYLSSELWRMHDAWNFKPCVLFGFTLILQNVLTSSFGIKGNFFAAFAWTISIQTSEKWLKWHLHFDKAKAFLKSFLRFLKASIRHGYQVLCKCAFFAPLAQWKIILFGSRNVASKYQISWPKEPILMIFCHHKQLAKYFTLSYSIQRFSPFSIFLWKEIRT